MTHPTLKLLVEEPMPGAFVWTLMELDERGKAVKVTRRADSSYDSYEAALAVGTRRLNAELHVQVPSGG